MHCSSNQFVRTFIGTIKAKRASVKPCCFLLFNLLLLGIFCFRLFRITTIAFSAIMTVAARDCRNPRYGNQPFALLLSCLIILLQVNFSFFFKAGFEILNFAFVPSSQNWTYVFDIVLLCTLDGSLCFVYSDQLLVHRCRQPESDL